MESGGRCGESGSGRGAGCEMVGGIEVSVGGGTEGGVLVVGKNRQARRRERWVKAASSPSSIVPRQWRGGGMGEGRGGKWMRGEERRGGEGRERGREGEKRGGLRTRLFGSMYYEITPRLSDWLHLVIESA